MARVDSLGHFLTDVADAIREKGGTSEPIQASDFDTEIENLPSGGGLDWSAIGYSGIPQEITNAYNHAKEIYDNWDSTTTNMNSMFYQDTKLIIFPLIDTSNVIYIRNTFEGDNSLIGMPLINTSNVTNMSSMFLACRALQQVPLFNTNNVTNMSSMFNTCSSLTTVPLFNTSKVTNMSNMFQSSSKLSDTSLDNILQMCIGATSYSGTKTLKQLGFNATNYPTSRIEALPHYQDFIDAGWTIGY